MHFSFLQFEATFDFAGEGGRLQGPSWPPFAILINLIEFLISITVKGVLNSYFRPCSFQSKTKPPVAEGKGI